MRYNQLERKVFYFVLSQDFTPAIQRAAYEKYMTLIFLYLNFELYDVRLSINHNLSCINYIVLTILKCSMKMDQE